jgi:uncharacterized membrane protein
MGLYGWVQLWLFSRSTGRIFCLSQSVQKPQPPSLDRNVNCHEEKNRMLTTSIFPIILILATLLCALVAGLLFAFAIVVMPGLKSLHDREFIRAFQVIDRVIQNNQPIFMLVWVGSVVVLVISVLLGFGQLDGIGRVLIISAALVYVLGVQLPTITINIPLNNKLQTLDVDTMNEKTQKAARIDFEPRWNRWNSIRTGFASLGSVLLVILLFIL